jgi:hypothetical protein
MANKKELTPTEPIIIYKKPEDELKYSSGEISMVSVFYKDVDNKFTINWMETRQLDPETARNRKLKTTLYFKKCGAITVSFKKEKFNLYYSKNGKVSNYSNCLGAIKGLLKHIFSPIGAGVDSYEVVSGLFRKFLKKRGVMLDKECYFEALMKAQFPILGPMFKEDDIYSSVSGWTYTSKMPPEMGRIYRNKDVKSIIEEMFGVSGKGIYKAYFANKVNFVKIAIIQALRGIFNNDEIQWALSLPIYENMNMIQSMNECSNHEKFQVIRLFFRGITKDRIKTILKDLNDEHTDFTTFCDTCFMYRNIIDNDHKFVVPRNMSIKGLHDEFSKLGRKITTKNFKIKVDAKIKLMQDYDYGNGFKMIFPNTNHDLIDWSQDMRNCISSYGERMRNKDTFVCAFLHRDKMKINAEFHSNFTLNQFYGFSNRYIDDLDDSDEMKEELKRVKSEFCEVLSLCERSSDKNDFHKAMKKMELLKRTKKEKTKATV